MGNFERDPNHLLHLADILVKILEPPHEVHEQVGIGIGSVARLTKSLRQRKSPISPQVGMMKIDVGSIQHPFGAFFPEAEKCPDHPGSQEGVPH
jgi:hypothetical protein